MGLDSLVLPISQVLGTQMCFGSQIRRMDCSVSKQVPSWTSRPPNVGGMTLPPHLRDGDTETQRQAEGEPEFLACNALAFPFFPFLSSVASNQAKYRFHSSGT